MKNVAWLMRPLSRRRPRPGHARVHVARRFPPPWLIAELEACFVGQQRWRDGFADVREYYLLARLFDPPFEKSRVPSERKF